MIARNLITVAERAYFVICLALGRLLRSARYSRARIIDQNGLTLVRKRRSFYAPLLIWMGGLVVSVLDTGQRVLAQREWEERERLIYQTLRGTSIQVDADGTLVLPCIAGETLATLLEDPDLDESIRTKAIERSVVALAEFHHLGLTHADAMAENVLVDLAHRRGSGVAHWFDFETIHDPSRPMAWRRADDVRALIGTCLIRTVPEKFGETLQLILDAYADEDVTRVLAMSFTSVWRRSLAFHLAQAGLSFQCFREIGRLLQERRAPVATPDSLQRHRDAVRTRLLRSDHVRSGSDSITWKVNREIVVIAGWGRAILLQLAHPAVAAGVHGHSAFRGGLRSSFRRLHSTVGAMLSLTFGDTEQMISAAARINAIHDRVRGATYSAHDPDLQRWVHATLLETIPLTYERLVGPLTLPERDRYCLEAAIMEPLLGMPAGWLPRDSAQLDTYIRQMLAGGTLVVTDTSRALARALLYPPRWFVAWPAFRAMQLLTIGSLPPSIRQAYGFEWRARDERALARWTTLLRTASRLLPPVAREWPVARRRDRTAKPQREGQCPGDTNATSGA